MANDKDEKEIQQRIAEARFARALRSKLQRKAKRRWRTKRQQKEAKQEKQKVSYLPEEKPAQRRAKQRRQQSKRKYIDIDVPEELDLFGGYESMMRLVKSIRRIALMERRRIRLVLDNAKTIKPAAMLCLVSEIYRCRHIDSSPRVTGTYPNDSKLKHVMQDTGFFDLLDVRNPFPTLAVNYPLEYIKVVSGVSAVGEDAHRLKGALLGDAIKMDEVASAKLYRGLTEAMTNVVQHAYPKEIDATIPRLRNRWWLVGHVDKKDRELMVMFFDQGVGIPETLPLKHPREYIQSLLSALKLTESNDGHMILAATRIGRTQTGDINRGRGLHDFRGFIDQCGGGSLRILSRRGSYTYLADGTESTRALNGNLGGTLIEWTVPLDKISNWHGE